jgi:outer membrane protein
MKGTAPLLAALLALAPRMGFPDDLGSPLTLKEAQEYALRHHPEILAADLRARSATEGVREARSGFFPQVYGNATAVKAGDATRIAATGGLNNPSVFQRESDGLVVSQLITDFGRTADLTKSARFRAESASEEAQAARARTLLAVNHAFFAVLGAEALLKVADQTVASRTFLLDKVNALARANLKSSLDVTFAEVSVDEAALLKLKAEDQLQAGNAELAVALGLRSAKPFSLAEEPLPAAPSDGVDELVTTALSHRPDLLRTRADYQAFGELADAESAARRPTIAAIGAIGVSPYRDDRLQQSYGAAGINLSLPVFTGGRLSARANEARLEASAAGKNLEDDENRIERDVRMAWLAAHTAYKAIEVTDHLLQSASRAFELAESRYSLGISSIVELSQAQLQQTEAQIASATARYEYALRVADLNFQVGATP